VDFCTCANIFDRLETNYLRMDNSKIVWRFNQAVKPTWFTLSPLQKLPFLLTKGPQVLNLNSKVKVTFDSIYKKWKGYKRVLSNKMKLFDSLTWSFVAPLQQVLWSEIKYSGVLTWLDLKLFCWWCFPQQSIYPEVSFGNSFVH